MDEIVLNERYGCMEVLDLGEEYNEKHPDEEIHYKCQCRCGRISYFNKKTLEHKPRYCYYPVMITENHYYCAKIREATERKRQKYAGLENVVLKADLSVDHQKITAIVTMHTGDHSRKERRR